MKIMKMINLCVLFFIFIFLKTSFLTLNFSWAQAEKKTSVDPLLQSYCQQMDAFFKKYQWKDSSCQKINWIHVRKSVNGSPLVWKVYGDEQKIAEKDTTMLMCGIHGDEITPVKFCYDAIKYLDQEYEKQYAGKLIVVAPLVNPDSFFKSRPSRVNQNGVDINRNFPTKNWKKDAHHLWKTHYSKDPRRNPGKGPLSEPEVLFQVNLIKRYQPDKIISVHAPLTMIDYDGPSLESDEKHKHPPAPSKPGELLLKMSKSAEGYRVKNYRTFPGSLGNWAGDERNIPTYTLELPSSDPAKSDEYWKLFQTALHHAFTSSIKKN